MYNNLRVCIIGAALAVLSVGVSGNQPVSSTVRSPPDNKMPVPITSSEDKNLNQRQIEDTSSTDFVDEMLNLFVQFINFDKASPSIKEESKVVENAAEGRGKVRVNRKFLLPFLLGISVKTKALILAAIGFLLVLTKITFIKSKIALVIGVGLLLYHLYVKKHAIHHIKHALHHPYDVSPAWSAPLGAWAVPDWGTAAAATGHLGAPYILRKTSEEHHPTRFRR